MASNLVPTNLNVPAHLANRIGGKSALAESLSGGITSGSDFPRISIKGSRFRIVEDGVETVLKEPELHAIIVGANPKLSKQWYEKAYDPDAEPTAPDCFSLDGIKPDPDVADPQNDLCATCPKNAWGSRTGPKGQQLKACGDQKRLALVSAADPTGPVYLLSVTPAALKGLNAYQKELSMRGIPPEVVVTTLSFDPSASFPKLAFAFGGFIDDETLEAIDPLFGSPQVREITGEARADVVSEPKATPKVTSSPLKEKPKAAPKEEEAAEAEEAPKPKRGFGTADAAPKAKKAETPTDEPKAAPAASASKAADDILALLGDDDDDE